MSAIPEWLDPNPPSSANQKQTVRELMHALFDLYWDRMIEMVAGGYFIDRAYDELIRNHPVAQGIHRGMFTRWMNSSPERVRQHEEACQFRSESLRGLAVRYAIADPQDDPQIGMMDVQSRKLAVDTLKWSAGVDNRNKFGDVKTINTTAQISVLHALSEARERLQTSKVERDALTIDHTDVAFDHPLMDAITTAANEDDEDDA